MRIILLSFILMSCQIEVPVDEIEVPPIENNTTIIVNMPDGLTLSAPVQSTDVQESPDTTECAYKHFPDYYSYYGAFVLGCTGDVDDSSDFVCCTWVFPEERQACEERWCRDSDDKCGWELNSWECYSY